MAQEVLHSLEELGGITLTPTHVEQAWERSIDRSELAWVRKVGKVENILRRNKIRFSFIEDTFRIERYRKNSDYPQYGYIRVYQGEYAFGTEEFDYNWSSRITDVVNAVKQWLGGASFSAIETKEC
jgi:hypothetical protein